MAHSVIVCHSPYGFSLIKYFFSRLFKNALRNEAPLSLTSSWLYHFRKLIAHHVENDGKIDWVWTSLQLTPITVLQSTPTTNTNKILKILC